MQNDKVFPLGIHSGIVLQLLWLVTTAAIEKTLPLVTPWLATTWTTR